MIIKLHQNLINKIAAGEVVERPSSVLKELIENSIDAKATNITVNIENYGLKLIEVLDNGSGMDREDAKIVCDSHSTSKISTIQDLENIASMGFRGEALASISAVSEFEIATKSKEERIGTKIVIDGGKKKQIESISTNTGTKISIKNLFSNIPARRKFLKSPNTEYKHLLVTFFNYALSFPSIHFILKHNQKNIYNLPKLAHESFNEELKARINDLFGKKITSNIIAVNYNSPYIQILGFLGHPSISKSQKSYQLTFLNKRPIMDRIISKAVYEGYHGLISKNQYPVFFLFIKINPSKVDINVHPRKSEVRFENPSQIFNAVKQAVRETLLKFLKQDAQEMLEQYPKFKKRLESGRLKFSKLNTFPTQKTYFDNIQTNRPIRSGGLISDSLKFTKELLQPAKENSVSFDYIPYKFLQVFKEFVIIEKDNELLFIDQHAGAERITFEKLIKQFKNGMIETQKLLLPEIVELNKIDFASITQNRKKLEKFGIKMSVFGKDAYKVEEIPSLIMNSDIKKLIEDIINELNNEDHKDKLEILKSVNEHIIAVLSCHTSIRSGMKLEREEIENLVKNLLKCDNPYSCPHGRPIIWKLNREELEKKFKRH